MLRSMGVGCCSLVNDLSLSRARVATQSPRRDGSACFSSSRPPPAPRAAVRNLHPSPTSGEAARQVASRWPPRLSSWPPSHPVRPIEVPSGEDLCLVRTGPAHSAPMSPTATEHPITRLRDPKPSVITPKAAIRDHFKTGHMKSSGTGC